MSLDNEFVDIIENFEDAYDIRKEDLDYIKGSDRKILNMHMGGIVLECLTKHLIVSTYNMEFRRKSKLGHWYSEYTKHKLIDIKNSGKNVEKGDYTKYGCILGQGHNFIDWIGDKDILNYDISHIRTHLETVYNPIEEDGIKSFIDLRYFSDENLIYGEIDEIYTRWEDSYNRCIIWLESKLSTLERKDYVKEI